MIAKIPVLPPLIAFIKTTDNMTSLTQIPHQGNTLATKPRNEIVHLAKPAS